MSTKAKTKCKPTRRVAPRISTNISSYDRRDPFLAFNVLLKLFTSLSSRIGGCHLKLTQEEHKLGLGLLNIVEPYIGATPSCRTLITRQPTEILDDIVFHIESRQDLLNCALSCRRMYDIVIPRHMDYRVLRAKASSISLWHHLISHGSLARNVRHLEILDERSTANAEVLPEGIMTTNTDLESTDDELGLHRKHGKYLVGAIARMTALSSISWKCNHSLISIDLMWPTLVKCGTLQRVEINDNLLFNCSITDMKDGDASSDESDAELEPKAVYTPVLLADMRVVHLNAVRYAYGATKTPSFNRIKTVLDMCPRLEQLCISYPPTRGFLPADDFFIYGRWPNLTSLSLSHVRPNAEWDAAATFLFAHPNLESLHLDMGHSYRANLVLLPNSLPRLRELTCNKEVATSILECPTDHPRPLETLKGTRLTGLAFSTIAGPHSTNANANVDTRFLHALKNSGSTVKRIELAGWNGMQDIERLAHSVPGLTWLDVGNKGAGAGNGNGNGVQQSKAPAVNANIAEWSTLLSTFANLATFHGVKFFYEVSPGIISSNTNTITHGNGTGTVPNITLADRSRIRKNDEIASVLAWRCPKLRRVDHWEEGGGKVVVLVRNEGHAQDVKENVKEKVKWEVRRVKLAN